MSNEKAIVEALKTNFHAIILVNATEEQVVKTAKDSLKISVEDIYIFDPASEKFEVLKDLKRSFFIPPNASKFKFFIVLNSDSLTPEMANSLLKIAEEPPAFLKIILLAQNSKRILATIRSRSQTYFLPICEDDSKTDLLDIFWSKDFKAWVDFLKNKEDFGLETKSALAELKKKGLNKNRQLYIDLSELLVKFENTNVNQRLNLENLFIKYNFK